MVYVSVHSAAYQAFRLLDLLMLLHFLAILADECLSVDWLLHVEFYRLSSYPAFAFVSVVDKHERLYSLTFQLELEKLSA